MLKDLTEMVDNRWGVSGGKKETQKELHGKSKKRKTIKFIMYDWLWKTLWKSPFLLWKSLWKVCGKLWKTKDLPLEGGLYESVR